MPQRRRKSKPVDRTEAQRLYDALKSYRKVARQLDSNYAAVWRALNPDASVTSNSQPNLPEQLPSDHPPETFRSNVTVHPVDPDREAESTDEAPTTALQTVEYVGEVSADDSADDSAELRAQLTHLKSEVEELKAHRLEVDAWIQAFQRQAVQTRAVHELPPSRVFLDPDDAKPERWNLWVPRGLKRLIDARAKATGTAPSQLVQRWLWQVLDAEEGASDA